MAQTCDYESQLLETARLVAEDSRNDETFAEYKLVFQSRSGSPAQPWLGPMFATTADVTPAGCERRGGCPIVFFLITWKLFTTSNEAAALCRELGLNMVRAAAAGTPPSLCPDDSRIDFGASRARHARRAVGVNGPRGDVCAPGCLR